MDFNSKIPHPIPTKVRTSLYAIGVKSFGFQIHDLKNPLLHPNRGGFFTEAAPVY